MPTHGIWTEVAPTRHITWNRGCYYIILQCWMILYHHNIVNLSRLAYKNANMFATIFIIFDWHLATVIVELQISKKIIMKPTDTINKRQCTYSNSVSNRDNQASNPFSEGLKPPILYHYLKIGRRNTKVYSVLIYISKINVKQSKVWFLYSRCTVWRRAAFLHNQNWVCYDSLFLQVCAGS